MKQRFLGFRLLLVLGLLLIGMGARGDNFMQNSDNYTCMQMGMDKIRFTLPTQYDGSYDEGISDGRVYLIVDGGSRQSLFHWWCKKYNQLDDPKYICAYQGGTFFLTGKVKNASKTVFTKNDGNVSYYIDHDSNDDDHYTTTVEWTVPRELRGHKLKIEMWCRIDDRITDWYIPTSAKSPTSFHELGVIEMPEAGDASVTLNEPMLAVTRDHINEVMFSYSFVVNKIFWAKLHYTDAVTNEKHEQALPTSTKVGFAYIPANRPWKDVYIEAQVTDASTKETAESYRIRIESDKQSSSMLHHPKGLRVNLTRQGKAELTWTVDNPEQGDISDDDFFEIQRNTSGSTAVNDPNWRTIDMGSDFMVDTLTYTYTDNSLMDQYQGKPVAYRVRRSVTAMWQWASPDTYQQYQLPWLLTLPTLDNATVHRTDTWNDEKHIVEFGYEKRSNDYDADGNFLVRNNEDFARLEEMVKNKQATYAKAIFYLSDASGWENCAKLVERGVQDLHIVLVGDVDLSGCTTMMGSSNHPFSGTVEGNGRTITVGYNSTSDYAAPFNTVSQATFRNFSVNGSIRTSKQFAGGLIGSVTYSSGSSVTIDKVSVSTTLQLDKKGDGSSGGFIGIMATNTKVSISNSVFKGSILGTESHSNGGIVGVAVSNTDLTLDRCLFAPTRITTMPDGCNTFARMDQNSKHSYTNTYYTHVYGTGVVDGKNCLVIYNNSDWQLFVKRVSEANGAEVNAVLEDDIHITTSAGLQITAPFHGTFEGNGHTLDVALNGGSNSFTAPFVYTNNATIRNLRVTGTVSGGIHSSGLIGSGSNSNNVIENVRVSVAITTTSTHAGGFMGHGGKGNNTITNCLFDGSITGNSAQYAGAFIGWEEGGTNNKLSNCLENGSYVGFAHAGMNYKNGNSVWNGTNCYSYHEWGEALKASSLTASTVVLRLGSGWKVVDDTAVPVMARKTIVVNTGGTSATTMSGEELANALGTDNWIPGNNDAYLKLTVDSSPCTFAIWDKRAKLQLHVKMHGENGVDTRVVDLSGNTEAIDKQRFTQDLTRRCVEYTFDMVLKPGTSPLLLPGTYADSLVTAVVKTDRGELASYRFMNPNRITKLEPKKKQSSVELTWEVSGGESDFYRVLRRNHTTDVNATWTDTLATNLTQQFFEDKTVRIQQSYDYRVECVLQCEGIHIESATCTGACEPTGRVSGYVRMADGTAMGGVLVECRPKGTIPSAQAVYTTETDETGFFEFSNLPYQINGKGGSNGIYTITIPTQDGGASYTSPNEGGIVNFTQNSNWTQNFNFYMDTYFVYSGNVYYRDTSIPVPGVTFKLDGKVMHDASQHAIETDTQGAFELSIPAGPHTVQAVKDGHYFASAGFLINRDAPNDSTLYNFNKNVSSAVIWDSTTVVLRGRVVGGDVQGSLPLGKSLSVNNLGDSLKIVMQLEGDNTSYLIRKQNDETVKTADYKMVFGQDGNDTTMVHVTRHTLTIQPDKKTGEFQVELHPAKYKVIEVSAQGYPTLFQQGKVGETVDLTFNKRGDVCEYSRIYHSVPTVDVKQFNPSGENFFGVKKLTSKDNIGNSAEMHLWYLDKDNVGHYAFGYPVFMAGSPYGFMMQACEKYYWNNDFTKRVDIVNLDQRGKISIKNALTTDSKTAEWSAALDSLGGCEYIFTPDDATFVLENVNALKTIDITLLYDGTYYDVKPFNGKPLCGYVMVQQAKREGRRAVVAGTPKLWDILRDPPGGGSTSYIEEGSKLSYGYNVDLSGSIGFNVKTETGSGSEIYHGFVAAPAGAGETAGTLDHSKSQKGIDLTFVASFGFSWNYSYNMDITERIQTRGSSKWIGGKGDLFIGTTENLIFQDALAVRAIPDSMYQIVKGHEGGTYTASNGVKVKVPVGTTKVLATGTDDTGKPVYLVRDEVMMVSPVVKSTFIHSQEYIEKELLPDLFKIRNALILPMGYDRNKAQQLANERGYATYISKVAENSADYGTEYEAIYPANDTKGDSIAALNEEIVTWIGFLAKNEQEKLSVMPQDLVKRYDFDGGAASIQYSESFSTAISQTRYLRYPIENGLDIVGEYGIMASWMKTLLEKMTSKSGKIETREGYYDYDDQNKASSVDMVVLGTTYSIKWKPILSFNVNDKYTNSETHSKKVGFTLAASSKSSLTVDVYHTDTEYTIDKNDNAFYGYTLDMLRKVRYGLVTIPMLTYASFSNTPVYSNFVFRTIAGTTCEPYEGERVTKWYQPGTVLDVATTPIDKPRIWIDQPVVSNVPFDEPARFVLHMANETDYPEQSSLIFNYYLLASSNPNGAKICVDGKPLGPGGENVVLFPAVDNQGKHVVFTKEITVYPSKAFDYEDLTICLYDPEDAARVFSQKFSAHFIPTAGKVKVTVPSDKWVVNTESPYDGKRKAWYMPVRIEGFDVNYPNFDHIELQYKLSTQGDKDWVSVCSYYADNDLRQKASGVTDTIPSSGIIVAPFYGETDPVEQHYDLRAAVYCRHAGGYLTGYSDVLTGIKDTRLPVLFGTPEPIDGILGIGSDIKFTFSEPIAGNYLRNINNFEVLGQMNSSDISTATALSFTGHTLGFTQATRNLSGKSFTIDVMLNPANNNKEMAVLSHGNDIKGATFSITKDRHLKATINGKAVVSDAAVNFTGVPQPVAWSLDQNGENMVVTFFNGSTEIGSKTIAGKYEGTSPLLVGYEPFVDNNNLYEGDMMELRMWNRAMTSSELDSYSKKRLTGYEYGLLNYYPMNEGSGEWAYDKAANRMDIFFAGAVWKRPAGIAMSLKGDKGLLLAPEKFTRSALHDYTLTFWFLPRQNSGTLFANGEAASGQENQLNIGLKEAQLYVRSAGYERQADKYVSTNEWHHFAMSVSRSQNVANVYLDKELVMTIPAENLSGIQGDQIALGATYAERGKPTNTMTGNIDEVAMYACALPTNLIRDFATQTPKGTMSALMAYLDFGRSEKMDDNTQHLEPTGISLKRYLDSQGNVLARRDTLVASSEVAAMADRSIYAPMTSSAQLDNLNYKFVAHDNQLLLNITEPDYMVEKTNIYVTVKDIPDLQGNLMASPVTLDLFVYRNPLRWNVKKVDCKLAYGEGGTIQVAVKNLSGTSQYFEINDLPVWITASQTSGTVEALGEQYIIFTVSPYINVGTYTELLNLTGENNMSEPLPVTLSVQGDEPQWAVSDRLHLMNQTMMMVTQVKIDNVIANSPDGILAVFDDQQHTLGVTHIEVNSNGNAGETLAYLTIYGYSYDDGSWPKLHFRYFNPTTGMVYNMVAEDGKEYTFERDALIGSAKEPVVLINEELGIVQTLKLKKGWNWVTLNVETEEMTVGSFFNGMSTWEPGDMVTTISGKTSEQFSCRENKKAPRGYSWDDEDDPINIKPTQMYNIYSMSDKTVYLQGYMAFPSITVGKGWNRIGFLSSINLPVAQALADYTDKASVGDILKSQDGFAVASAGSQGIVWKGTLQFMEAGKGYMMKRVADGEVSFDYPIYFDENRYSGNNHSRITRSPAVNTATTMNIVAAVEGIDTDEADRLVVFRGAQRMAEATADDEQRYYLNIGCDDKDNGTFTFAIEREGEIIATTPTRIAYVPNSLIGTPDAPTAISFTTLDQMPHDGLWYTISGLKVGAKKPTKSGVYIHNGKAVLIEN